MSRANHEYEEALEQTIFTEANQYGSETSYRQTIWSHGILKLKETKAEMTDGCHLKHQLYIKCCIKKRVWLSAAVHICNTAQHSTAPRKLRQDNHKVSPGNTTIQTQKVKSHLKLVCDRHLVITFMRGSKENISTTMTS